MSDTGFNDGRRELTEPQLMNEFANRLVAETLEMLLNATKQITLKNSEDTPNLGNLTINNEDGSAKSVAKQNDEFKLRLSGGSTGEPVSRPLFDKKEGPIIRQKERDGLEPIRKFLRNGGKLDRT